MYERKRNNNANVYNDAHAYDGASAYTNHHAYANANNNACANANYCAYVSAICAIDNYDFYVLDNFKKYMCKMHQIKKAKNFLAPT